MSAKDTAMTGENIVTRMGFRVGDTVRLGEFLSPFGPPPKSITRRVGQLARVDAVDTVKNSINITWKKDGEKWVDQVNPYPYKIVKKAVQGAVKRGMRIGETKHVVRRIKGRLREVKVKRVGKKKYRVRRILAPAEVAVGDTVTVIGKDLRKIDRHLKGFTGQVTHMTPDGIMIAVTDTRGRIEWLARWNLRVLKGTTKKLRNIKPYSIPTVAKKNIGAHIDHGIDRLNYLNRMRILKALHDARELTYQSLWKRAQPSREEVREVSSLGATGFNSDLEYLIDREFVKRINGRRNHQFGDDYSQGTFRITERGARISTHLENCQYCKMEAGLKK